MHCMKRELKKEKISNAPGVEESSTSGIGVLLKSIDQIFRKNSNLPPYIIKMDLRIPRETNSESGNKAKILQKGQNRLTSHKWQEPK